VSARTGFWSSSVAPDWEHGLVAGTGTIGAVLSGDPARHTVHVCHEEFFLPVNSAKPAPAIAPRIAEVRAAAFAGDSAGAAELTAELARADGYEDAMVWTDPFVYIAAIEWMPDANSPTRDYRRAGDFTTGRVEAGWLDDAGSRTGIALVPDRASGAFAIELSADAELSGVLAVGLGDDARVENEYPAIDYNAYLHPAVASFDGTRVTLDVRVDESTFGSFVRTYPPSPSQPDHARLTLTIPRGVDAEEAPGGVRLRAAGGTPVVLAVTIELFGGTVASAAPTGESHESLFGACSLDLHSGVDESVAYDTVLELAKAEDPAATLAAVELAFAAGRHTIISSTGELPPTLVGIWQGTRRPAWSGDWTQNGNVQHGGVASLVSSGTPELFTSYLRAIFRHVEHYAENAERVFGAPGWMLPARFDSHGRANHFAILYPHLYWMAGGAWVLRMAWDQFSATGDLDLLRTYAWPLAQNVMAFAAAVAEAGEDGALHLAPSYSPENTPANRPNPIAADATMDVAAFRDAARIAERIAGLLGVEADLDRWRSLADDLPAFRVAADGTFAEWLSPVFDEEIGHRHASQLYPFWYEDDPAASSPELRAAARETIHRKLAWRDERPWGGNEGRMEMAFGLVGLGLAAARLGDADAARRCVESLAVDFWRANAVSTHDGEAIFNVDASGGLPALVIEMLVQSQPNRLSLLPALPESWRRGTLRGVRARGGVIVERLDWDENGLDVMLLAAPGSSAAREGDLVDVTGPDGTTVVLDLSQGPVAAHISRSETNR
jgi:alpha-L-fucosidase 2